MCPRFTGFHRGEHASAVLLFISGNLELPSPAEPGTGLYRTVNYVGNWVSLFVQAIILLTFLTFTCAAITQFHRSHYDCSSVQSSGSAKTAAQPASQELSA